MPSDAVDNAGPALKEGAVNAQDILNKFYDQQPFAIIFLLDCCRTYHLRHPDLAGRAWNQGNSAASGIKPMFHAGSLIAFACAPGTIASDGKGRRNGLFTEHLLKHLPTRDKDIRLVLSTVTNGVMGEVDPPQIPYYTASLRHENICLCDGSPGNKYFLIYCFENWK